MSSHRVTPVWRDALDASEFVLCADIGPFRLEARRHGYQIHRPTWDSAGGAQSIGAAAKTAIRVLRSRLEYASEAAIDDYAVSDLVRALDALERVTY